jgi:hypothetical protein
MEDSTIKSLIQSAVVGLSMVMINTAHATLIVSLDNNSLDPNQAGQQRSFLVTSSEPLPTTGIQFNIQIFGNTEFVITPIMTQVDILSGTVFQNNNNGQAGGSSFGGRVWEAWTLTSFTPLPNLPAGPSLMATVTFDTTGLSAGHWALSLAIDSVSTTYFDSSFSPLAIIPFNDTLTITAVPEPAHMALGVFGVLLAGARGIRWALARRRCGRS